MRGMDRKWYQYKRAMHIYVWVGVVVLMSLIGFLGFAGIKLEAIDQRGRFFLIVHK